MWKAIGRRVAVSNAQDVFSRKMLTDRICASRSNCYGQRCFSSDAIPTQAAISSGIITPSIPKDEYQERRAKLAQQLPPNSMVIVAGNSTVNMTNDIPYRFRQNSNFHYLAPFPEPAAVLMLLSNHNHEIVHSSLAVLPKDAYRELWDGHRIGPQLAPTLAHVAEATTNGRPALVEMLRKGQHAAQVFVSPGDSPNPELLGALGQLDINHRPLGNHMASLRSIKSSTEIECLRAAARASSLSFNALMAELQPDMYEWEVDAWLEHKFRHYGCRGHAYPPVVAAGKHALTLHYVVNNQPCPAGQLLLIDAGAERGMYNADITRTYPIDGTYKPPQRQLYDAVLRVQRACMQAVGSSEGQTLQQLNQLAMRLTRDECLRLGILSDRSPLGRVRDVMPHSIGHHLGLDVHDLSLPAGALEAGSCITIEPGLYIPFNDAFPKEFQGIGVRIEDNVAITERGLDVLTKDCMSDPDAIEHAMLRNV